MLDINNEVDRALLASWLGRIGPSSGPHPQMPYPEITMLDICTVLVLAHNTGYEAGRAAHKRDALRAFELYLDKGVRS